MKNLAIKCVFKRIFYRRDAVYRQYSPLYAAPVCREIICNGKMLCNTAPLYCRSGLAQLRPRALSSLSFRPRSPLSFRPCPSLLSFRLNERQRTHGEISKSCITFLLFWPCPSLLSFRPSEASGEISMPDSPPVISTEGAFLRRSGEISKHERDIIIITLQKNYSTDIDIAVFI